MELACLLIWSILIWRGTDIKTFFSAKNALILTISGVLITLTHIYGLARIFADDSEDEDILENEGLAIFMINLLN